MKREIEYLILWFSHINSQTAKIQALINNEKRALKEISSCPKAPSRPRKTDKSKLLSLLKSNDKQMGYQPDKSLEKELVSFLPETRRKREKMKIIS